MRPTALLAALAIGLALPTAATAQTATNSAVRVDSLFARWSTRTAPGCAVGVSRNGAPVFERAYGMADLEHDVAATAATVYEAGSVSKQITAAAVVLLAQQGKLSLDDDVRKHVPEVPDYGTPITIRHLLNHTSGLRDWGSVAGIAGAPRGSRTYTHAHVLDIVSRQKALNYTPGAAYSYTNTGYNLLAIIVDRVSGMPFAQFSRTQLFEPIGMRRTQWRDDYTRIVKDRAIAYSAGRDGGYVMDMPFENVHGNGGLLTTVGDLLLWTENLETGKVGGAAFLKEMHKQAILTSGREITYASGLVVQRYNELPEVSHTGTTAGYRAFLARYPQQRVAVALLCNNAGASSTTLGHAIADAFLGVPARPRAATAPAGIAVPMEELRSKAGLYRDPASGASIRLVANAGVLSVERGAALVPLSRTSFQVGNGSRRFTFEPVQGNTRPRIRETNDPDEAIIYEPVPDFAPTPTDLAAYAGEYYSADAEVAFVVAVENGALVLQRRPDTRMTLRPAYADAFDASLGRIRFTRDGSGRVTGFSIRQERVWDLRFVRR